MTRTQRKQREARQGALLLIFAAIAFVSLLAGAAYADSARGMTVSQSLSAWGL